MDQERAKTLTRDWLNLAPLDPDREQQRIMRTVDALTAFLSDLVPEPEAAVVLSADGQGGPEILAVAGGALYVVASADGGQQAAFGCSRTALEGTRVFVSEQRSEEMGALIRTRHWTLALPTDRTLKVRGREILNSSDGPDDGERVGRALAKAAGWPS